MRTIFESNLFSDGGSNYGRGLVQLNEFLGMETANKIGGWFRSNIQKSREMNRQRNALNRQQRLATSRASTQNIRRMEDEANADPARFVNRDFSNGMVNFNDQYTQSAIGNARELNGWENVDHKNREKRNAEIESIYDFDQASRNAFVGAPRETQPGPRPESGDGAGGDGAGGGGAGTGGGGVETGAGGAGTGDGGTEGGGGAGGDGGAAGAGGTGTSDGGTGGGGGAEGAGGTGGAGGAGGGSGAGRAGGGRRRTSRMTQRDMLDYLLRILQNNNAVAVNIANQIGDNSQAQQTQQNGAAATSHPRTFPSSSATGTP